MPRKGEKALRGRARHVSRVGKTAKGRGGRWHGPPVREDEPLGTAATGC